MRTAIVSDLHANENAFRHVLADARSKGVSRVVCLGDIVGYGPLPNETAALARETCAAVIAGNHDDAVTGRIDAKDFIGLAGDAVQRHREALSPDNLGWLKSLDHTFDGGDFIAAHGDFTDPAKFFYIQDESDAEVNFRSTATQLMFVGHTHTPQIFLTGQSGKVYMLEPTDFVVEDGKRYIVNPGSVGYPRDNNGTCLSSYVIYDSDDRSVTFHTLPFAVSSVMQRGQTPKKARKITLICLLALSLALIGYATYLLSSKDENPLILKRDKIQLTPELRQFLPNIKLSRGSVPIILKVVFIDGNGQVLDSQSPTIKQSRSKAFVIPTGTTHAEITLLKQNDGDSPQIECYKPAFKP